ncbi:hypothetical protein F5Y17DRAFT_425619 [Xylariaceae sp. FL0594]|nr:hypothetical protein F5Y17DRAFT_425619 [Xylariaceae sp. FL0594]
MRRTLKSTSYLRCFYCGQRSDVKFNGQKSFDCSKCDATNWLDKDGEITDPPIVDESPQRNRLQFAIPRSSAGHSFSQPSSSQTNVVNTEDESGSVFCDKCLRNQYMFSSSLAQFEWPDDVTSREYASRERSYFALRRDLERRYPQVCDACIPKVNARIEKASYTAQTDHLRRMLERTQSRRAEVKRRGMLDVVDGLGKLSWYTGFALQAVWHLTILSFLLTDRYFSTRDGPLISVALGALHRSSASLLPYAERSMQWAINLGVCSFPWNPRFKQTIRGFTVHIFGFRQWYTYQLLILLIRFVSLSIAQYSTFQEISASAQLSAQLFIPSVVAYVFSSARRTIQTDTRPLFRRPAELSAGLASESKDGPAPHDPNDLGAVLDEILNSPASPGDGVQQTPPLSSHGDSDSESAFLPPRTANGTPWPKHTRPISTGRQEPAPVQDYDVMDWSPSGSQHRAFSSVNPHKVQNPHPRFSDMPIEPKPGPIWYKIPPAPTTPAQRARNPPMRPIIRESPKEPTERRLFTSTGRKTVDFVSKAESAVPEITLSQPKFFAPEPKNDPRDSLSSMFANTFNLGPDTDPEESDIKPEHIPNRTKARIGELLVLLLALGGWVVVLGTGEQYGRNVGLAVVCVYLIVSIRLAADLQVDHQIRDGKQPSMLTPCFANLAMLQVIFVLLLLWVIWSGSGSWDSSGLYGSALFGSSIIHHIWHIFA